MSNANILTSSKKFIVAISYSVEHHSVKQNFGSFYSSTISMQWLWV